MTDTRQRPHRIVIGATCYADASSVIDIGFYLAESTQSDVQAILVEQEAVFSLSGLPRARATPFGGSSRPVTPEAMIEAFRRDAAAYEKAVREGASKRAIRWSFESRRGEFPVVLNKDLSTGDLIVLGYQALRRSHGELLVADFANDLDVSLLELAAKVAGEQELPLHVVLLRSSPESAILVSEHARSRMRQLATDMSILDMEDSVGELLDAIRRGRVATVMISSSVARTVGVERLLEAVRCPLIIFTS